MYVNPKLARMVTHSEQEDPLLKWRTNLPVTPADDNESPCITKQWKIANEKKIKVPVKMQENLDRNSKYEIQKKERGERAARRAAEKETLYYQDHEGSNSQKRSNDSSNIGDPYGNIKSNTKLISNENRLKEYYTDHHVKDEQGVDIDSRKKKLNKSSVKYTKGDLNSVLHRPKEKQQTEDYHKDHWLAKVIEKVESKCHETKRPEEEDSSSQWSKYSQATGNSINSKRSMVSSETISKLKRITDKYKKEDSQKAGVKVTAAKKVSETSKNILEVPLASQKNNKTQETRTKRKSLTNNTEPSDKTVSDYEEYSELKIKIPEKNNQKTVKKTIPENRVEIKESPAKTIAISRNKEIKPLLEYPPLKLFYWNPNSLGAAGETSTTKKRMMIENENSHLIFLVEPYHKYEIPGFKTQSGCTIKGKNKIYSQVLWRKELPVEVFSADLDLVVIKLTLAHLSVPLFMFCVYLSHDDDRRFHCLTLIRNTLEAIDTQDKSTKPLVVMVGDFNRDLHTLSSYTRNQNDKLLATLAKKFSFAQDMKHNEVTRERSIKNGQRFERSRIDWLLMSMRGINVRSFVIKESMSYSDHFAFMFDIEL